jgi:AraC family transcriptional activator FtrA
MNTSGPLVVALVYDGLCTFEFGIAVEVFGLARPEFDFPWYRFVVCSGEPGKLLAIGGVSIEVNGTEADLIAADTIIIPGWRGANAPPPPDMLDIVRAAHARGTRLVSICGGVFVLAAAGLLDGRRASTHWMFVDQLRDRHPKIVVDADALYVDEGSVLTSAGSAAGIDLCLHLVRKDFGAGIANRVARRLIAQPHREGGQSQYIDRPVPEGRDGRMAELLDWMIVNLRGDIRLPEIAARAHMSQRTLLRRFRTATGMTPKFWLLRERVRRSQQILEATDLTVEVVAHEAGFGSAEAFRYHFRRITRTTPKTYRLAFRGRIEPAGESVEARAVGADSDTKHQVIARRQTVPFARLEPLGVADISPRPTWFVDDESDGKDMPVGSVVTKGGIQPRRPERIKSHPPDARR